MELTFVAQTPVLDVVGLIAPRVLPPEICPAASFSEISGLMTIETY